MEQTRLNGKRILLVDDEVDVISILEELIGDTCPNCKIDKATNFKDASDLLSDKVYDIVVLDIMGVRGFDLLEIAVSKELKVAMFTAHQLAPEALKKSYEMGARAYLPKEKLPEIVSFLEDILKYDYQSGWKMMLKRLEGYFDKQFGPGWKGKADFPFWY